MTNAWNFRITGQAQRRTDRHVVVEEPRLAVWFRLTERGRKRRSDCPLRVSRSSEGPDSLRIPICVYCGHKSAGSPVLGL